MKLRIFLGQAWPWALAGLISGMAILTRATGLILFGVVGLALILQVISGARAGQGVYNSAARALVSGIVWLIATIATIYALLPALWIEPRSTILSLWSWSSNAATEGHENPTFFRGIHSDDPGLLVYPVALAWRTSPTEWFGLTLFLLLIFWGWRRRDQSVSINLRFLLICIVFAVVYVSSMSLGAKKFDRYILPVFPVIALLAACGFALAWQWIHENLRPCWSRFGAAFIAVILLSQVISWNGSRPYRLDYYNPVLGGAEQAQNVLQMGWGQGGDQVVAFLEEQTGSEPITVQTSAVPSAFTYFMDDDSPVLFPSFSLATPAGWYETDFYVAGIQQTQRGLTRDYSLLQGYDPVHSVLIGGVSYFDIYNVRNLPLPAELSSPTACNLTFDDSITLMQIVRRDETIDLYFLTIGDSKPDTASVEVTVEWPDGTGYTTTAVLSPASTGNMSKATIPNHQSDLPLDEATITLGASTESGPMEVSAAWTNDRSTLGETHSECFYTKIAE